MASNLLERIKTLRRKTIAQIEVAQTLSEKGVEEFISAELLNEWLDAAPRRRLVHPDPNSAPNFNSLFEDLKKSVSFLQRDAAGIVIWTPSR